MAARRILMVSPEAVPFSKTGGLGDVAGALPLALAGLGHEVTLVVPRYRGTPPGAPVDRVPITIGGRVLDVTFGDRPLAAGARAVLVDCPELYDRAELYGVGNSDYPDNAVRFALLSRAALEFAVRQDLRPEIVHAHDWQAGLSPVYLRTVYAGHPALAGAATVFTIHNLAYQGLFSAASMPTLDLPWNLFGVDGLEYWGRMSFLKAGINLSEFVTTVSPRYAREIQTPEFGFGFDGILARRSARVVGILNGIDVDLWDPERDPHLPKPFGPATLDAKAASKRALLEAMTLPVNEETLARPLVGMVSRLVDQKGFDLLAAIGDGLLWLDATFVLLGSGEPRYQAMWQSLRDRAPGRVGVSFGFNERLAHLIEGGADIFLMPSRFEPCGLNQMYSLRYGTVPVVRAVGGLDDTIDHWNPVTGSGTGFKFWDYSPGALWASLQQAVDLYRNRKQWRVVQRAGMARDFSWRASAVEYARIYERARNGRAAP